MGTSYNVMLSIEEYLMLLDVLNPEERRALIARLAASDFFRR
jgi:hypothetical protein